MNININLLDDHLLLILNLAAAVTVVTTAVIYKKVTKKVMKRKPVRKWLSRRTVLGPGVLQMLNDELAVEDCPSYRNYLRMNKEQFNNLLSMLKKDIEKTDTFMQETISAKTRLEITLRFLATGESYRSLMYSTRVHESSISRFIPEVAQAIYKHLHIKYVKTPDTVGEWLTIAEEFDNLWQFPNCLGALDGRHIKFTPPRSDGSYFFNYKGDHSIVLLALADARYKFSYINVGCNGRVSDGGVFKDSALATAMSTNRLNFPPATALPGRIRPVPYVIVADDAFPLKDAIMKPYPFRGLSHDERIFNYRLSRARRIIENAFGILANRFRVLLNPIHLRVTKVETITLACVALHNYLATENGNLYTDLNENDCTKEDINKISRQGGNKSTQNARDIREEFKQYFCSNIGSVEWQERAVNNYNM